MKIFSPNFQNNHFVLFCTLLKKSRGKNVQISLRTTKCCQPVANVVIFLARGSLCKVEKKKKNNLNECNQNCEQNQIKLATPAAQPHACLPIPYGSTPKQPRGAPHARFSQGIVPSCFLSFCCAINMSHTLVHNASLFLSLLVVTNSALLSFAV